MSRTVGELPTVDALAEAYGLTRMLLPGCSPCRPSRVPASGTR